ncbi:MAG: phosphoribosyltransferase [Peptostreptococcus porci]|uniref:phosphoribosyltransferase n=1 Tax=Peptostreptococcus porci TaxID=2652282 RepID=UPI002A753A62|nr:phosphoribosyltransferase [Peptostreptococcus porci]MDY2794776.1 phosphoribosyltransferase [Peptostreptococcus porci]MDY4561334.1 phosphoribosyltransferase [Peptostreptococcus porci]
MKSHIIQRNNFLSTDIQAYFNTYYVGYKQPDNPNFLNELKNTFNDKPLIDLEIAKEYVYNILIEDIPQIIQENHFNECALVGVPRSKAYSTYSKNQLLFNKAIKKSCSAIRNKVPFCKLLDGSGFITRLKNTKTTHIRKEINGFNNDGDNPYPGITKDTCAFAEELKGQNIILIDDIYTATVNIDEDCIQALLDWGAKSVVFYSIGYTKRY